MYYLLKICDKKCFLTKSEYFNDSFLIVVSEGKALDSHLSKQVSTLFQN